jgi:DNA-binding MarR family transcriptional regulator
VARPVQLRPRAAQEGVSHGEESIGYLIRSAHRAFVKALAQALEPYGISPGEWSALRVLWREEGLTQVELAERMRVEKASLTGILSSLEAKAFVTRVRNLEDRRKINLRLSPAGRNLEAHLLGCGFAVNERAAHGIAPSDMTALRGLLNIMIANLDRSRPG